MNTQTQTVSKADLTAAFVVLAERLKRHQDQIAALERDARMAAALVEDLQGKMADRVTGVCWSGKHEAGKTYYSGELVQKGGLWLCIAKQTHSSPGGSLDWKLIVHRAKMRDGDDD